MIPSVSCLHVDPGPVVLGRSVLPPSFIVQIWNESCTENGHSLRSSTVSTVSGLLLQALLRHDDTSLLPDCLSEGRAFYKLGPHGLFSGMVVRWRMSRVQTSVTLPGGSASPRVRSDVPFVSDWKTLSVEERTSPDVPSEVGVYGRPQGSALTRVWFHLSPGVDSPSQWRSSGLCPSTHIGYHQEGDGVWGSDDRDGRFRWRLSVVGFVEKRPQGPHSKSLQ